MLSWSWMSDSSYLSESRYVLNTLLKFFWHETPINCVKEKWICFYSSLSLFVDYFFHRRGIFQVNSNWIQSQWKWLFKKVHKVKLEWKPHMDPLSPGSDESQVTTMRFKLAGAGTVDWFSVGDETVPPRSIEANQLFFFLF